MMLVFVGKLSPVFKIKWWTFEAKKNSRKTAAKQGIYTISGTKLGGETKNLPKGIYIVNGKKSSEVNAWFG